MAAEVRIEPVEAAQLDALLPLIAAYQRFYEETTGAESEPSIEYELRL